ncbi:MAG: hypothetical protein ACYDBJ_09725 [Aggregatilineales bacterium]
MSKNVNIEQFLKGTPIKDNATWWSKIVVKMEWQFGGLLNWLRLPGVIKPVTVYDSLTNTQIKVATGHLFTVVSINGNDYYFRRLDGKYDGSGKSV